MERREFIPISVLWGIWLLLNSCTNWGNEDIREEARKALIEGIWDREVTDSELIEEIMDIFERNNIPGYIADNFNNLTVWVSHWSTGSKLPKIESLHSQADVDRFEKLIEAFVLLSNHKEIVFVVEGCDFRNEKGLKLWKINEIGEVDCLTPPSIKEIKNAMFTWVDPRSIKYWQDAIGIHQAFEEYESMINVDIWVPQGESYSPIDVLNSNTLTAWPRDDLKQSEVDELISVMLTLWRVRIKLADDLENEMRKVNKEIIDEWKFPIFIVGSSHTTCVRWSYILANSPEDIQESVMWTKRHQYLRHIIKSHIKKHWDDFSMYNRKEGHLRFKKYL